MTKHHHQSREEQIVHRIQGKEQAQQDEIRYEKHAPHNPEDVQKKDFSGDNVRSKKVIS